MKGFSKNKKGISLIVLIITLLVLSILATVVIVNIGESNIISEAENVVFRTDMANYKQAYYFYIMDKLAENPSFDKTTLNVKDYY